MYIELSYPIELDRSAELLPSVDGPKVIARSRIKDGKSSNTSYIHIYAHHGTHVDSPWHFNDEKGFDIMDFGISDFIFKSVQFIQINKVKYAPISLDELQVYSEKLTKCDALLINTGFSKFRDENPSYYFKETPGFTEEAAEYISQFKNIKCIGFDFISVENIIRNREKGYPIHHILLSREIPIILIEDMKLDDVIGKGIKRLFVIPIRIRGIEASPVTAFAEVDL